MGMLQWRGRTASGDTGDGEDTDHVCVCVIYFPTHFNIFYFSCNFFYVFTSCVLFNILLYILQVIFLIFYKLFLIICCGRIVHTANLLCQYSHLESKMESVIG